MKLPVILLVTFACMCAFASEPGQPLDCSDWVFLEPGHYCTYWVPPGCTSVDPTSPLCSPNTSNAVLDNEGRQYAMRLNPTGASCCNPSGSCISCHRFNLVRYDGVSEVVIAYLDQRPNGAGGVDTLEAGASFQLDFDQSNGRLLVWLTSEGNSGNYTRSRWVAAIGGFATTFDVLQSFTPQTALSFRVPYMPEGMAGADHFDTYWGNLTKPIDFTQAHPFACDYPADPPHVGDHITVLDTVPTPLPGQGVYYVTSATYQGATRYGRKTTAGHLSGRDPAMLPACVP